MAALPVRAVFFLFGVISFAFVVKRKAASPLVQSPSCCLCRHYPPHKKTPNTRLLVTIMTLRTYGDKPMSFQLEENGEYFYVGSEVRIFIHNNNNQQQHEETPNIRIPRFSSTTAHRLATICACSAACCTKSTRDCSARI